MARNWFGGDLAGWVFGRNDTLLPNLPQLAAGVIVTFWDAPTAGTQYTDLLLDAVPVASVSSSNGSDGREHGSLPPFQGPDNSDVLFMWAQVTGATARYLLLSRSLADRIIALQTQVNAIGSLVVPEPFDSFPNATGVFNDPGTSPDYARGDHTHSTGVVRDAVFVAAVDATTDEKSRAQFACDGIADEVQIQAAYVAAVAAGIPVQLSTGHFIIEAPIEVEDPITFLGAGREVTILEAGNGLDDYIIRFTSESSEGVIGARFADFFLDGHCDEQTTDGGGIWAAGAVQCTFERIRSHNAFNWGLVLGPTFTAAFGHHNKVLNCLFDASLTSAGFGGGVWCTSSDENWFAQSDFEFLGGTAAPAGLTSPVALYDQAGLQKIVDVVFVGGRNNCTQVRSRDTKLTQVVACTFDGSAGDAVVMSGTRHVVQGNTITSPGDQGTAPASGIYLEFGAQGCVVDGNVIDSSNTAGKTYALIRETGDGDAGGNIITSNSLWVNAAVTSVAGPLDLSGAGSSVANNLIGPPA